MPTVLFEIKKNVALITLNRPEKYNAFNREMAFELQARLAEAERDKSVRCVLLTGQGKAFSAGQDLMEITSENAPTIGEILSQHYNPIITKIRNLQKPVLAAVNGIAAGAGANIALCCDVVVAADNASFVQAFSKIGLIPDSGGTFFLPRLIGFQKSSAAMMLGDKIDSAEAERIGMIYKVLPVNQFPGEALLLAETLANLPTTALAYTKAALNQSMENNLSNQLALEDDLQQKAANTKDFHEGVKAFQDKRSPNFTGE